MPQQVVQQHAVLDTTQDTGEQAPHSLNLQAVIEQRTKQLVLIFQGSTQSSKPLKDVTCALKRRQGLEIQKIC